MKDVILGLVGVGRIGVMHANNIAALNGVLNPQGINVRLRLTDVAADHARAVAAGLGAEFLPSVEALLASGLDGLVIATGTGTHPELIKAGVDAGIPVFCEKPVALNVADALPVLDYIRDRNGVVQIGHQRRFDAGYQEARRAYQAGELGWIHSLRAVTCDMAPPPVEFLASSGGLFRDCSVHDFDILRWLTGREIVEVYARGSNNGDPAIGAAGDVDTALALVTFDDGTVGTVSATRYNGAGHDVRLEIQGSRSSLMVGPGRQNGAGLGRSRGHVPGRGAPPDLRRAVRDGLPVRDGGLRRADPGPPGQPLHPRGRAWPPPAWPTPRQESLATGVPVRVVQTVAG